jgi:hypothetical protein
MVDGDSSIDLSGEKIRIEICRSDRGSGGDLSNGLCKMDAKE